MNKSDENFTHLIPDKIMHVSNRVFLASTGRELDERIRKINAFKTFKMYEEALATMRLGLEDLIKYLYKTAVGPCKGKTKLSDLLYNEVFRSKIGDNDWLENAKYIKNSTDHFHHSSDVSEETDEEYHKRKENEVSYNRKKLEKCMLRFQSFIDSGCLLVDKFSSPGVNVSQEKCEQYSKRTSTKEPPLIIDETSQESTPCDLAVRYKAGPHSLRATLRASEGAVNHNKYDFSWCEENEGESEILLKGFGKRELVLKKSGLAGHVVKLIVTGEGLLEPLVCVYGPILKDQVRIDGHITTNKIDAVINKPISHDEVEMQDRSIPGSGASNNTPGTSKAAFYRMIEESTCKTWGPTNRPTYTWSQPADHVTFNSITDNPTIGDERNFVRVKKYGTNDLLSDSVDLEVGAEYEVYIYYHNNASANLNESGRGIASNVRLLADQPNFLRKGEAGMILGRIHCAEVKDDVWDTAWLHTGSTVLLRYVANSAVIHTLGSADGIVIDSRALFGENGTYLAYSTNHWGIVPGCNEYSGYVTYRFKVDRPGFNINCYVKSPDESRYGKKIIAKPGEVLDFMIEYHNTGTINQLSIIANDHLPNGLEYIEGSSFFSSNFYEKGGSVSDKLFHGGINLGDYKPGDFMHLEYKVKVLDDPVLFPADKEVELLNDVSVATANGTGYVKALVIVKR